MKSLLGHNNPPEPMEVVPSRRRLITALATAPLVASLAAGRARAGFLYGRRPWTPFDLGPTVLLAWWRARDYAMMTDDGSGLISNWPDRVSGLAITAATTARATWGAASFNSAYPGMTFDGSANCYVTTTLAGLPTSSTAGEIWGVGIETVAQVGVLCAYGSNTNGQLRSIRVNASNQQVVSDGTAANTNTVSPLFSTAGWFRGQWSGTAENGWFNGAAFASNPVTIGSLSTGTTRLRIGASNAASASSFFGGVLSDILIVSSALATSDAQKLDGWIAWNRGLTANLALSHPYKYAPP